MTKPASTTILLIRHGHTEAVGVWLAGRSAGVHLTDAGRAQADRLPARVAALPLDAIYTSPLERARETAAPLARVRQLPLVQEDGLSEVAFGEWTGLTFVELETRADWRRFNTHRSTADVPGGERATEVQQRIVRTLERLRDRHPAQTVAVVSHADVIRAAVLHYLGAPLDMVRRLAIAPASVTTLTLLPDDALLVSINQRDPG